MNNRPLLEVISTSPQDSRAIAQAGADRIELVSALQIGGLTPSKAIIRRCLQVVSIPTMVMVRHHNQGFVLNQQQSRILVQQAQDLVDSGVKGLVIGAITTQNLVDQAFLKHFRETISNKIDVTFHKASDFTPDLSNTYLTLKEYDINRVLTQGGSASVLENSQILQKAIKTQGITTLIGGGINQKNVQEIIKTLSPKEIHIGTCVRSNRYENVDGRLVNDFLKLMQAN